VSLDVHERWSQFLAQQGFAVKADLGTDRAFARTPDFDTGATRCVDLNHFAALTLVGADANAFLQGYVTCDMDELDHSRALVGAYCNIKGRVVADTTVVLRDGNPTLLLHASLRDPVAASLKKYLAFARSRFLPADAAPILLGIVNPPTQAGLSLEPFAVRAFRTGVAIGLPGEVPRVMLVLAHDDAVAVWLDYAARSETGDAAGWDLVDVRAGIAHVCAATSETFLPQMLDYDRLGAVSFTKGCYLGQEIVARTQHLGRPKRHLHHLQWTGAFAPAVGTALEQLDKGSAGTLVAIAATGPDHGEALAVLGDAVSGSLLGGGVTFTVR
jgi:tRNA-modifying protein YgfZ